MGLFEKKVMSKDQQRDFAEGNFYQYYGRYAGKSADARDQIWLAELHATYSELQYLRELEDMVIQLKDELASLRSEIERMKSNRDTNIR